MRDGVCSLVQILGMHYTSSSNEQAEGCTCMSCICRHELSNGWNFEVRRRVRVKKYNARIGAQGGGPDFRSLEQVEGHNWQPNSEAVSSN